MCQSGHRLCLPENCCDHFFLFSVFFPREVNSCHASCSLVDLLLYQASQLIRHRHPIAYAEFTYKINLSKFPNHMRASW